MIIPINSFYFPSYENSATGSSSSSEYKHQNDSTVSNGDSQFITQPLLIGRKSKKTKCLKRIQKQ